MAGNLQFGDRNLQWGDRDLLFGGIDAIIGADAWTAGLVRLDYEDGTAYALWTGLHQVIINSIQYDGLGQDIISISREKEDLDGSGNLRVTLNDVARNQRDLWLEDPGRVVVTFNLAYSIDKGDSWHLLDRGFTGLLADAEIQGANYTFTVTTTSDDRDRGYIQRWSDTQQQAQYEGDLGFSHLKTIAQGRDIVWPRPTR